MGIKTYKPYTPSRRNMTGSDFSEITKTTPEKSLVVSLKKNSGRNNQGKITVRHRGGGSRRKYRIIDFKRNKKDGIPAVVTGIEYDPNRTANIALIYLCRWRESLHPCTTGTERWNEGYERCRKPK